MYIHYVLCVHSVKVSVDMCIVWGHAYAPVHYYKEVFVNRGAPPHTAYWMHVVVSNQCTDVCLQHTCVFSCLGNRLVLKLGDKEVDFNPDFKFYITTKLSNPHYTPEISTKTAIVNFAVKEQGLEAQLLGVVVRKERRQLEDQKDSLVVNIASSKKKLVALEDEILRWVLLSQLTDRVYLCLFQFVSHLCI